MRWPRATIIRRAGETRRRGHALFGAVLVVVALIGAGKVVHDPSGVQASLRRTTLESPRATPTGPAPTTTTPHSISAANLLPGDAVRTALDTPLRTWTETRTATLADGNGLVLPCQQARYAEPDAQSALYRTYAASRRAGRPTLSAIQATEFARTNRSARAAYRATLDWFAGCTEPSTQLLSVRGVDHVGDRATQFVLRQWSASIVGEYDLPPIIGVDRPWVGTRAARAKRNAAASGCDKTSFTVLRRPMTRTFVIPGARLSPAFGLTETTARTARGQGGSFVDGVRRALATCSDRKLGTKAAQIMNLSKGPIDLTVWRVSTEISDQTTVPFMMAVLRRGDAVGQLGFLPDGRAAMRPGAFVTLSRRALDRLAALP